MTCGKDPVSGPWFPYQQGGWGKEDLVLAIGPGHSDMKTDSFMSYILISHQIISPAKERAMRRSGSAFSVNALPWKAPSLLGAPLAWDWLDTQMGLRAA